MSVHFQVGYGSRGTAPSAYAQRCSCQAWVRLRSFAALMGLLLAPAANHCRGNSAPPLYALQQANGGPETPCIGACEE